MTSRATFARRNRESQRRGASPAPPRTICAGALGVSGAIEWRSLAWAVDRAKGMKRILVVLSSSPASRYALVESIKFAKQTGAHVRIARVANLSGHAREQAEAWLDEMIEAVPLELRDGACILTAHAPAAIAREAESYGADAVVLAARTYKALKRVKGSDTTFEERVGTKLLIVRRVRKHEPPALIMSLTANRRSSIRWRSNAPAVTRATF